MKKIFAAILMCSAVGALADTCTGTVPKILFCLPFNRRSRCADRRTILPPGNPALPKVCLRCWSL